MTEKEFQTSPELMQDALYIYRCGKTLRPVKVPSIYMIDDSVKESYIEKGVYLYRDDDLIIA